MGYGYEHQLQRLLESLEVGQEGKLGGQADVPDAEGVWLELMRKVSCIISGTGPFFKHYLYRSTECA